MTAEEFFEIETNIHTDQSEMPTIADIIKPAQDPDEDLTDTTDKDNDEQESMKISMDMGLEYGTKFLAFLEQQEEGIMKKS